MSVFSFDFKKYPILGYLVLAMVVANIANAYFKVFEGSIPWWVVLSPIIIPNALSAGYYFYCRWK